MKVLRVALPLTVLIAGFVVLGVGPKALGGGLIGVSVVILVLNWVIRLGFRSQDNRDSEEQARRTFTRTGHWPS